MKKTYPAKLVWLLLAIPLFFACDDSAPYYGKGIESEFNKLYSSKWNKDHVTADLSLTYSGEMLLGKDIYFNLMTENTAEIKFFTIFPGEGETVIEDAPVTKTADGYSFSGNFTTERNTTFTYSGTLKKTEGTVSMNMALTDIRIPQNPLLSHGSYKTTDYNIVSNEISSSLLFQWTVNLLNEDGSVNKNESENILITYVEETGESPDLTPQAHSLATKILYLLLEDITFHPDGNITANYAPLPEDPNFQLWAMLPTIPVYREETSASPLNLLTYYFDKDAGVRINEDNKEEKISYVYIRPNIENIIYTIQANRTRILARSDEGNDSGGGLNIMEIINTLTSVLDLYSSINRWSTEGMRFTHHEIVPEWATDFLDVPNTSFSGDYFLYLDNYELKKITNLIPLAFELFDINPDLSDPSIPSFVGPMLDSIVEKASRTSDIKIGLILHEN